MPAPSNAGWIKSRVSDAPVQVACSTGLVYAGQT